MKPPRILVRRHGALGDVLLTTPVISKLWFDMLGVKPEIHVETAYPQVFAGNPHVAAVYNQAVNDAGYDRVIDLNMAYERRPDLHITDAYLMQAFGRTDASNKRVVFGIDPPPPKELIAESSIVTIHAARSWPSRNMSDAFWGEIAMRLAAYGYTVQFIGGPNDFGFKAVADIAHAPIYDMRGLLNLRESTNAIAASRVLLCADSAMMHFAGATDTPIVALFTSTLAEARMPWRHGEYGWRCCPMRAQIDCQGCLATTPPPVTYLTCKRGDNACTEAISVDEVLNAVTVSCVP